MNFQSQTSLNEPIMTLDLWTWAEAFLLESQISQ